MSRQDVRIPPWRTGEMSKRSRSEDMNDSVSRRVRGLPGSKVREIFDLASNLENDGRPVIHLEIGRPWSDTPAFIKDEAKLALDRGEVHYSPNRGLLELRHAIAEKLERENGIVANPETEILVTSGNKQATFLAAVSLLDPGDEVIITDPHYGPHYKEILFVGAVPRMLPLAPETQWGICGKMLEVMSTDRTKMIIINTPHNPTGRVFARSELQAVADLASASNLIVLTDETYEYFVYEESPHLSLGSFPGMRDRTLSTFAFTKSYAMDGWRLGYAVGPKPWISAMTKVVQLDTAGPNTFGQYGAIAAARSGSAGAREMREQDRKARDLTMDRLHDMELPCTPIEGTIYAFPNVGGLSLDGDAFAHRLLTECDVAVTPGSAFGSQGETHIRIAFGAAPLEFLSEALNRMQGLVERIREDGTGDGC